VVEGSCEGTIIMVIDGEADGFINVATADGVIEGAMVGTGVGFLNKYVGFRVGCRLGDWEGDALGLGVGARA
jgi:hypothetical protein